MRVAIEAASLALTSGGLARYTSELSLALARTYPEDEYYLVSDQPFPALLPANRKAADPAPGAPLVSGASPRRAASPIVTAPIFTIPAGPPCHPPRSLPWMNETGIMPGVRRRIPLLLIWPALWSSPAEGAARRHPALRLPPERVVSVPKPPGLVDARRGAPPARFSSWRAEPRKNLESVEAWLKPAATMPSIWHDRTPPRHAPLIREGPAFGLPANPDRDLPRSIPVRSPSPLPHEGWLARAGSDAVRRAGHRLAPWKRLPAMPRSMPTPPELTAAMSDLASHPDSLDRCAARWRVPAVLKTHRPPDPRGLKQAPR